MENIKQISEYATMGGPSVTNQYYQSNGTSDIRQFAYLGQFLGD